MSVASWSCSPISNTPATVNSRSLGTGMPDALTVGTSTVSESPIASPRCSAITAPTMSLPEPAARSVRRPWVIACLSSAAPSADCGSMPRSNTGSISGRRTASACSSTYSATEATPSVASARRSARLQSSGAGVAGAAPGGAAAATRTCAPSVSSRSRSSPSKPFITERMTMRAATPTQTPPSDAQVMKDTKNSCERART